MSDIEQLKADLQAPESARREQAAEALATAGELAAGAAVELVEACADEGARDWAVEALENMGSPSVECQGALIRLLDNSEPLVSYWAATLLGRMGAAALSSQEALAKTLAGSTDLATRQRAAWALGQIGCRSESAKRALQAAAEEEEPRLSRIAAEALSHG